MKTKISFILTISILVLSLGAFFLGASTAIHLNFIPRGDGPAYLETAISIEENGGVSKLIPRMLTGDYTETNRHPLYVALLSTFAERDLNFFANAKAFTFMISAFYLFILFYVVRKVKSTDVALITVLIFGTNYFFHDQTAKISTEPLFMLFVLISWFLITNSFYQNNRDTFAQGISTGLAYLSKVTGIFLIPAYVLTAIFSKGKKAFSKHMVLFFAGIVLVSLPLLWRNSVLFDNPIYNYNSKLLFISSGEQRKTVEILEGGSQGASEFLSGQSLSELTDRVITGLAGESVVITQVVAFDYTRLRGALLIALLFLYSLYKDKNRERAVFSFLLVAAFYMFFSWYYVISGHFRYILPVVFIFLAFIVDSLYKGLHKLLSFLNEQEYSYFVRVVLLLVSANAIMSVYNAHGINYPWGAVEAPERYQDVRGWVAKNVGEDDLYLNGPGHEYQVGWLTGTADQTIEMPYTQSFEDLQEFLKEFEVDYVIISRPTIEDRNESIGQFFEVYPREFEEKERPPGWELVFGDFEEKEPRYMIYKVSDE